MKSPSKTILIVETNKDISDRASGFHVEDCKNEDDHVEFRIENATLADINGKDFLKGNTIRFNFGYIEGKTSSNRTAVIVKAVPKYRESITIEIKCRDTGFYMKNSTSNVVYKNKTASEIAEDIAKRYGYKTDIEKTTKKYETKAQGNKNFAQLLKELAKDEGADGTKGPFETYVLGDTLVFKRRNLSAASTRTYTYGDGNGTVKSFEPEDDSKDDGSSTAVTSSGVDMDTGKAYTSKSEKASETNLGDVRVAFDYNANVKDKGVVPVNTTTGKAITAPANNKAEADKKTAEANKNAAAGELKAELEIELDPSVRAGDIITMAGVGDRDLGNWEVIKAVHTPDDDSTKLSLTKNATNKATNNKPDAATGDKNKSQGANNGEVKNNVVKFDYNANGVKSK